MECYQDCHDFYYALTGLPIFGGEEVGLGAFEFMNIGLFTTAFSLAAITKLKP
jgi:ubiquinone biosynthesis protein COQ4